MSDAPFDERLRRLAHDLRGPLNTIVLRARTLERRLGPGSPAASDVAAILAGADKLSSRIAEFAEARRGAREPEATPMTPDVAAGADSMPRVRVLLVEDNAADAARLESELLAAESGAFSVVRAASLGAALARLEARDVDVVLLDLFLPDSEGLETLHGLRAAQHDAAVVVLTGIADRTMAIEAVRGGAQDYLIKGEADGALVARSIAYAVERKRGTDERERLIADLLEALATVKKLSGLLPICASCKRIRDENGRWHAIEAYVHEHSEAIFSHGICPTCAKELYPEVT